VSMAPDLEQLLQDIGALAMEAVPEGEAKVLVWAEQEGGTVSADLISGAVDDEATFRLCPPLLEQLIAAFWEDWRDVPGNREWIAMAYVVEDGGFAIDLSYAEDFEDREEEIDDLRRQAIEKHFGAALIDYSRPA
jgi:hypothetical protein